MRTAFFHGPAGWAAAPILLLVVGCKAGPESPADSGGTGGSGPPAGCPASMDDLISDFNLDNGVFPTDGRQGGWYTYADGSGCELKPSEGGGAPPDTTMGNPNCGAKLGSLHVTATGCNNWGAATGVDFMLKVVGDAGVQGKGAYDATRNGYKGVAFWARAAAPVRFATVKFLDPYTDRPSILSDTLWCDYKAGMPAINCSPYIVKFGYGYTGDDAMFVAEDYMDYVNYRIDETWRLFRVLFADAKQDRNNPGRQSPGNTLAVSQLVGMALQVNAEYDGTTTPPTPKANDFEIWIDDVHFIK